MAKDNKSIGNPDETVTCNAAIQNTCNTTFRQCASQELLHRLATSHRY